MPAIAHELFPITVDRLGLCNPLFIAHIPPMMHLILVRCVPIMLRHKIVNQGFSLKLPFLDVNASKSCIICITEMALAPGYASECVWPYRGSY